MFSRRRPLVFLPFALLLARFRCCLAYPQFTQPVAGSTVPVGEIVVQWVDSNTPPLISELTSYTLKLMVGGNDGTMQVLETFVSDGVFQNTGNSGSGNISAGIAGPLNNGFFFQIISTTREHDTNILNYSDRFSISGLDGITPPAYINAVVALKGSTAGPAMYRPLPSGASSVAMPSSTSSVKTGSVNPSASATTVVPSSSSTHHAKSSGPSSAVSVGIGIGVALGVGGILIIILAVFFIRRKRRRNSTSSDELLEPITKAELPSEGIARAATRSSSTLPFEADHGTPLSEMDSSTVKFELEGDTPPLAEATTGRRSTSSQGMSPVATTMTWRNSCDTLATDAHTTKSPS